MTVFRTRSYDVLCQEMAAASYNSAQWGKLGGHVDIVILTNLLSHICYNEPLLVLLNQL